MAKFLLTRTKGSYMKYIIIGLGNYGYVLAEELAAMGNEVIGADSEETRVDSIKDKIATAMCIDATDMNSLSALPLDSADAVVVTIGENFGASIRVVALLKQLKVKHIYARSIDDVHKSILEAFQLEKILTPEEDAARRLVELWEFNTQTEAFKIDDDNYIMMFQIPDKFVGFFVNELNMQKEFNLRILAIKRLCQTKNLLGITVTDYHMIDDITDEVKIEEKDILVCMGQYKDFRKFWRSL